MAAFQGNHHDRSNGVSATRDAHSSSQHSLASQNLTPPFPSQPHNQPSHPPQSTHGFARTNAHQVPDSLDAPYLSTSPNVEAAHHFPPNAPEALTNPEATFRRGDIDHTFFPSGFNPNWDPSAYNSFLDVNQIYQPQGQLANEQAVPVQAVDQSTPYNFRHSAESTSVAETGRPATEASQVSFPPPSHPQQPPGPSNAQPSGAKRKAESDPSSPTTQALPEKPSAPLFDQKPSIPAKRMSPSLKSSTGTRAPANGASQDRSGPRGQRTQAQHTNGSSKTSTRQNGAQPETSSRPPGILTSDQDSNPQSTLPAEKVFPIQIGSELFRLSGASIGSDAPSYFSRFFEEQLRKNEDGAAVRTLYIDRDPITFREISRHLQGYHIKPQDGAQFVKLFADAQFYSLPRLMSQLFESEIFVQIGDRHFQIPRDIFSDPGNSPNFFSLGFAVFFASPDEVFPGLDRQGLLRPPSIVPPSVPNRSADVFAQILHLLRGYPLHIENEDHRAELLRDCRYFHLRGLEQKLIAHEIRYNAGRQKSEISLRIEDTRPSGIQFSQDESLQNLPGPCGWVHYARPFVDDKPYELILELGDESTVLDLNTMRPEFCGLTKARISSLIQVIANKINLKSNASNSSSSNSGHSGPQANSQNLVSLSDDAVWAIVDREADIRLDGEPYTIDSSLRRTIRPPSSAKPDQSARTGQNLNSTGPMDSEPPSKRKRANNGDDLGQWIIRRGQWRLRVQPDPRPDVAKSEFFLVAVKLDAFTEPRTRNMQHQFLG